MGELRIIGTAHVSKKSVEEVREALEAFKPSIVAVELDPARYNALKQQEQQESAPSISEIISGGNFNQLLVQWLLAYVQKQIGMDFGVEPGAEMKAAMEGAERQGIPVALIDRDIRVTLARFWSSMSILEKLKLVYALLLAFSDRDQIDPDQLASEDMVTLALDEFRNFSPGGARALIDERDAYIAKGLLELTGRYERVLAVVGAGHVRGIRRYLDDPEKIPPMSALSEVKRGLPWARIISVVFLLLFVILIAGIAFSGLGTGALFQAIIYWVVIHGLLAGVFALAAGAHPLSILTACAVSWMTALNPLVAAGWFAAITEAKLRRPKGEDFRRIMEAEDFSTMRRIPLFRVVLVAALTNVGSTLATFVYYFTVLPLLGIDPAVALMQGLGNLWHWVSTLLPFP